MSQTHRYLVNLVFDPEYKGYVADVPQLPGCMSQGKTVEAALRNVRSAIRAYLRATGRREFRHNPEVLTSQVEVRT
jgi:predicted RNase H-like HicB family nuclease